MADTFTWRPDKAAPGTFTQRIRSAQFGNGYTQRAADGINNETQSWDLTFTGEKARIAEIMTFIRTQQGYKAFIWSTPFDGPLYFTCSSFKPTDQGGGVWQMTATFEQTYQVS
ncbi:phage tail protein [Pseudomonas typographi]|uniref:phage tail protein n=1 Tax=Pseudomonas typographi TaxID=2715964 RepID=UPI001684798F|nr:phage tail protein [Pseudomonas typographi]MBD1554716.1 phage tail protein [Pseudomonas typographi]